VSRALKQLRRLMATRELLWVTLAMSRSSTWASVLTSTCRPFAWTSDSSSVTGEYWSDSVTGLNDLLPITVLELCFLERFGARSTGSSSPLTGE
jgi:hypothetical protein